MTERLHFHFSLSCIGEGNGNPLHCSCLENPRDGGAWWAAVYGIAQSRTRLKRLSSSNSRQIGSVSKNLPAMQEIWVWSLSQEDPLEKEMASHSSILLEESHGQRSLVDDCPWGPRITHNLVTKPPPQTNVKNLWELSHSYDNSIVIIISGEWPWMLFFDSKKFRSIIS